MKHLTDITAAAVVRKVTKIVSGVAALMLLGAGGQVAIAKTLSVAAGGDLQKALEQAEYGDVVELESGATFEGNFTLRMPPQPKQPTTLADRKKIWITIRSSAHQQLPTRGTRVSPAHAKLMPKIVSPNSGPALATMFHANRYQLVGLEITTTFKQVDNLILLGSDGPAGQEAKSLTQLPSNIVIERCYIHGTPKGEVRRGIALNGRSISVMDCYLSDLHAQGEDAQAICGWNGSGPFKIVNNFLEASGENVLFGGRDPAIRNLVPTDIEIRYNHFFKPHSWHKRHKDFAGMEWTVKNLLELKNARKVLVEGNIFENCWAQADAGFAIVLTPHNQGGTAPWSTVEDVTIQKNLIRNTSAGVRMMNQHIKKRDGSNVPVTRNLQRVTVRDNVFWNISSEKNGGNSQMFLLLAQPSAAPARVIAIENNTLLHGGKPHSFITVGDHDHFAKNLVVRNNITTMGDHGVWSSDSSSGMDTIEKYFDGFKIEGNVFVSSKSLKRYPPNNYSAARVQDIGFRDPARGDFRLLRKSRYRNLGTDRLHPGADHVDVVEALQGVQSGDRSRVRREREAASSPKQANGKRANPRVSEKSP